MVEKKSPIAGLASQEFDAFCAATTLKTILGHHRHLCELLRLKPSPFPQFYPKLKSKLSSWKAKALWAKFDKRASHKCYNRGKACPNTKLLIIGGGPCGLRTAIEAQLLGAKVVVLEKRDRISRHNVLHLWPFVIHDLKALNAKKFFGKFCAGAIDHISIRQLQYILLKVALILGVEFHEGVCFDSLIPPPEDQNVEKNGWRAKVTPADHPVSQYEFDVLIGADGKRNTLEGFKRKEFRGKLAIAITANFINRRTEAEARVEEISGVAFIFNQKFFKDLYAETGIDLENIVYYKDETHYFVMTAKKHSLISSGVILNDYPDTIKLLSPENKDQDALMKYARDAAEFSTNYIMQNLEFAVDHYGQPDVAMFDFTSMFAAENASRVVERHGYKLLQMLVGDSLLEPFWPTGSGCARGFLSSMDACWAIKNWGSGQANVLEVLAERESIYRILGQTTPENLQRDYAAYTLDPHSRYPNLNKQSVNPIQVKQLFDTDDPAGVELPQIVTSQDMPKKRRRKDSEYVQASVASIVKSLSDANVRLPTPSVLPARVLTSTWCLQDDKASAPCLDLQSGPISVFPSHSKADELLRVPKYPVIKDSQVHPDTLLHWLKKQIALYDRDVVHIENVTSSFKNGLVLCAIIHRYRPDLIEFQSLKPEDVAKNNQLAFDILERELGVPPVMTGLEMEQCDIPDKLTMLAYLSQIYDTFRGEIPHIKHPKLEPETKEEPVDIHAQLRNLKPEHKVALLGRITGHAPRVTPSRKRVSTDRDAAEAGATAHQRLSSVEKKPEPILRKPRKRRSQDKLLSIEDEERLQRIEEIRKNRYERQLRRQYIRKLTTQQFYKSMQMLQTNARPTDDTPFEDYSLFVYRKTAPNFTDRIKEMERKILYPDREARIQEEIRKGANPDENLSDRVKLIEEKLRGKGPAPDKKPKDLNRAIGKIERSDWNVKEIEKKIQENKMGRGKKSDRGEKVPKWSREQFDDKFQAMKTKLQRKSVDKEKDKYADIDVSLKRLDRKIKEGSVLDMGQRGANKVSALAEQLAYKTQEPEKPAIQKSSSKAALVLPSQGGSEACHFCNKRVYLMERLSAEGKFFHRGCFRCEYCSTTLRLGNYAFDRDGRLGSRFFCIQHFGQQTTAGGPKTKARRKSEELRIELGKENVPSKKAPTPKSVERVRSRSLVSSLLGKGKTDVTEKVEHADAVDVAEVDAEMSDEDGHSEMDEDEWTDVNFGASAAEGSSDSLSDLSDSEGEEAAEALEAALEPPEMNAAETRRLAEKWTKRHSGGTRPPSKPAKLPNNEENNDDEDDESESESYDDDASDDGSEADSDCESDEEDSDTATEGEDEREARELRRLEVPLDILKGNRSTDSGSDTEIASDEYTSDSESEEEENSATEISTDSEFEHDGTTPTQHEIPSILIDDVNVTFRRRVHDEPKKVQVRTGHVIRPVNGTVGKPPTPRQPGVKLEFKNLRPVNEPVKSSSLTNLTSGINNINNKNIKLTTVVVPTPLINPRRGDYLLNRTLSTEGIASKLSLELKKKYLLGTSGLAGSVKKSGSASTIDSTFKSVVDVISEQQKLLKPAAELSPSMQAFLQGTSQVRPYDQASPVSPTPAKEPLDTKAPFEHVCARRDQDDVVRPNEVSPLDLVSHSEAPASVASPHLTALAETEGADCRPRSPAHETSIVVPDIPWVHRRDDDDMDSDSLSSESSSESDEAEVERDSPPPPPVRERTPPRVEVHDSSGEVIEGGLVEAHEAPALKLPTLPAKPTSIDLFNNRVSALSEKSSPSSPPSIRGDGSESLNNEATLALTETEWSDWAHDADAGVSEDLEDVEFNINPQFVTQRRKKAKSKRPVRMARGEDFNDFDEFPQHVCGKKDEAPLNATQQLLSNSGVESIEFMDTGDEDDSDVDDFIAATNKTLLRNNGYVQFIDEELDTPIVETPRLPHMAAGIILLSEVGETSDGPDLPSLDTVNRMTCSGDDDSFQPEGTDDTTTSDLVTVKDSPLEQLDTSLGDPFFEPDETVRLDKGSGDYEDYVQRLQGRISPFSNVRDSIDIRKARKPASKIHPAVQEQIREDVEETPIVPGGGITQRLEEISRDRSKQKDLVREMVMGKLSGQRRSQERKGKRSITKSPLGPAPFSPCNHADVANAVNGSPTEVKPVQLPVIKSYSEQPMSLPSPPTERDAEPGESTPTAENDRDDVFYTPLTSFKKMPDRPLSVHSSFRGQRPAKFVGRPGLLPDTPLTNPEAFSCPDIRHALFNSSDDPFKTPVAPPRARIDDKRTADREQARIRARLKSDEELGLSPEDYIKSLKQKVLVRSNSRPESISSLRTLQMGSGGDIFVKNTTTNPLFVDSESTGPLDPMSCEHTEARSNPGSPASAPAVLTPGSSRERIKAKDSERRKSGIIQAVSDFFHKKKDSSRSPSPSKEKFSRFKFNKGKGKQEKQSPGKEKADVTPTRSGLFDRKPVPTQLDTTPPPIPPPPSNYLGNGSTPKLSAEDSLSEHEDDSRATAPTTPSHCVGSSAEFNGSSKRSRTNQRMARQVQLKRHRMAQEIQRQLEELDVKQRELERRGVTVEKALRGEGEAGDTQEEEELLREWFNLMREQSELRRYERELLMRAEELELEDRHTRLQQELRDKMSRDDANKSSEDVVKEGQILAEMLDIVERKDSLVSRLEEDRLRYQEEDRDLEAQMVAKGLRVTPRQVSHV